MQELISILHLNKDGRLVAVVTPDPGGLDHIVYLEDASEEVRADIMRILAAIPLVSTLAERVESLKSAYTKEGYTIEVAV